MQPPWKIACRFLNKLKNEQPYKPAIPILGICPKKMKTLIQKDMYIPVSIADLSTITKMMETACPSVTEENMVDALITQPYERYRYKYSAIKRNEVLLFATWMNLKCIVSEIMQTNTACFHLHVKSTKQNRTKPRLAENRVVVARGEGGWEREGEMGDED